MGDICECRPEWLKEFISSLTVHREHKSAECFSPCFLLPVSLPSLVPGLPQKPCEFRVLCVCGGVGGGWVLVVSGRELPAPSVLATCLENIQIACVICKPLSHPGGSYISCHYPGGPSRHSIVIISYSILLPRQGKPDPTLCSTSLLLHDKRTSRMPGLGVKNISKVSSVRLCAA